MFTPSHATLIAPGAESTGTGSLTAAASPAFAIPAVNSGLGDLGVGAPDVLRAHRHVRYLDGQPATPGTTCWFTQSPSPPDFVVSP